VPTSPASLSTKDRWILVGLVFFCLFNLTMDLYLVLHSKDLAERASANWFAYFWAIYADVDRGWIVAPWSLAQEADGDGREVRMMKVHASHPRARPHRHVRKAGEGVREACRQVRVVDREPMRLEAGNLTVPENVGVGVALGQYGEAVYRDHAPPAQAVTQTEGREIGRSRRMDQLACQALGPIEPWLDNQDLVATLA
jgi:hypothetical protein